MIVSAKQTLKDNYNLLGKLSDAEFVAAKARARQKRIVFAEKIISVKRIDLFGKEEQSTIPEIQAGDTIKLKATVRSMLGGPTQTGIVTLEGVQDVYHEDGLKMLVIDSDTCILSTMDCGQEMGILSLVVQGNNWVTDQALCSMILDDATLGVYQEVREEMEQTLSRDMDSLDALEREHADFPKLMF